MAANRFLERSASVRIAGFVTPAYPAADQAVAYAELAQLAGALDAEARVFHRVMPDPRQVPAPMRALVGTGFYLPEWRPVRQTDLEHVRDTMPVRFAQATKVLAGLLGVGEAELLAHPDALNTLSHV